MRDAHFDLATKNSSVRRTKMDIKNYLPVNVGLGGNS